MSKMKFGLNTSLKKSNPRPSIKPKAFLQDDEDNDSHQTETQDTKHSHKHRINKQLSSYSSITNKKIEEQHKQALEEDPNIFDYDAVYDDLKTAEKQKLEQMKGKDNKKVRSAPTFGPQDEKLNTGVSIGTLCRRIIRNGRNTKARSSSSRRKESREGA